eukprot:6204321-Pleurochrysis_carterae.AAC.1
MLICQSRTRIAVGWCDPCSSVWKLVRSGRRCLRHARVALAHDFGPQILVLTTRSIATALCLALRAHPFADPHP